MKWFLRAALFSAYTSLLTSSSSFRSEQHDVIQEIQTLLTSYASEPSFNMNNDQPSLSYLAPLPPKYQEVKLLESYPMDSTGAYVVDVWDYMQRMSLYKYLVENTPHCEYSDNYDHMNSLDRKNILWGLPLQHGWQFLSGRLVSVEDNDENNSTSISTDSWWGSMNYYLSVLPYLGAMDVGLAPAISIKYNPDPTVFCDTISQCENDVRPWSEFFQYVNDTRDSCASGDNDDSKYDVNNGKMKGIKTPIADAIDFNLTQGMESLLGLLWTAHLHSIDSALPKFAEKLKLLPEPEQRFGSSWATIVDFIAATFFPCDMPTTDVLQNLLPPRVLQDGDKAPFISDFSRLQNRAVLFIDGLDALNTVTKGAIEEWWSNKAMVTEPDRALGREMITLGVYRPVVFVEDMKVLLSQI